VGSAADVAGFEQDAGGAVAHGSSALDGLLSSHGRSHHGILAGLGRHALVAVRASGRVHENLHFPT
jgi:hypothetical protein